MLFKKPITSDIENRAVPDVARTRRTKTSRKYSHQFISYGRNWHFGFDDLRDVPPKAQRYISREPRPTPGDPLDEIFIDTIEKWTESVNSLHYAVIITDARKRMRWIWNTKKKDEITSKLIKWVDLQHCRFGKRIRVIFRNDGFELRQRSAVYHMKFELTSQRLSHQSRIEQLNHPTKSYFGGCDQCWSA